MNTTKCSCGKRALKNFDLCKACDAKKEAQYYALIQETNKLLKHSVVVQKTAFGPHVVDSVRYSALGVWMDTHPEGTRRDEWNSRGFMIDFGVVETIRDQARS